MNLAFAVRTLRRAPRYAVTVVLTLAGGIALTAATFSVFRSVILAPVPYAPADRAMTIFERDSAGSIRLASYPTFQDWRAGTDLFEGLAFVRGLGQVMKTERGGERLLGGFVTEDFFRALPGDVQLGRTFGPDDHHAGAPAAMVLTHRLWRRAFGGDPGIVGRSIVLGERSYTVVGVMAPSFGYPIWAEFYAPIGVIAATDPALTARGLHVDSRVVARLAPGVDSAGAARALGVVAARLADAYPAESGGYRAVSLAPVSSEILGGTGPQLRLLALAAGIVLLIACVNVANLSLARTLARTRELAIRTALGAARGELARLLAAECVVLAIGAGALGLFGAWWLVALMRAHGASLLPRVDEIALDVPAAALSVVASLAVVVVFGLLPALRSAGPGLTAGLKDGAGAGTGRGRRRLRGALVVTEFALAVALLAGAALLARSLLRVQRIDSGFEPQHLLAVPVEPPGSRYDDPGRALSLYRRAAEAVAAIPGVEGVALTNHVPLSGASINTALEVDGLAPDPGRTDEALFREVDARYFRTVGTPLIGGRDFTDADIASPGGAVIVNRALAARYWPNADPIGRRITVFKSAQGRPDFGEPIRATVVGIVGDVRHYSLDTEPVPEVYLPYTITAWPRMSVVARVRGDPSLLVRQAEQALLAIEPDLPLRGGSLANEVYPVTDALRQGLAFRRLLAGLVGAFALPACLLAAVGIFGVIAYLVSQRERELAVRVALGASRGEVLRLVLREGLVLSLLGVGLGLLGALAGARLIEAQLFQVRATDPVSLLGAATVLVVVGLVATYLPARRAAGVDPMRALRSE